MAIGTWFRTDFDEVQMALDLPAVVTGGQGDGVRVVDQVVRGVEIVGRLTGDSGAVGLKVNPSDQSVRVTVRLSLDDVATYWWADRVKPPPGTPERPRLVVVRSQGVVRGAAVLARRQGRLRARTAAATVEFTLVPAEVGADGLLVVEICPPPAPLPGWADPRLSDRGAIGLRIDRICVTPIPIHGPGTSGVSGPPDECGGCGFVVGTGDAVVRIGLDTVPPSPPVRRAPTNRWTRRKPARAAARVLRLARRVAGWAVAQTTSRRRPGRAMPYGVDLVTGEPVAVDVVGRAADSITLHIAPATGPVLLGLDDGRRRERTGRQLACTPRIGRPAESHGEPG